MQDLGQRLKTLEVYTGSIKNRVEELIQQRDPRHNPRMNIAKTDIDIDTGNRDKLQS